MSQKSRMSLQMLVGFRTTSKLDLLLVALLQESYYVVSFFTYASVRGNRRKVEEILISQSRFRDLAESMQPNRRNSSPSIFLSLRTSSPPFQLPIALSGHPLRHLQVHTELEARTNLSLTVRLDDTRI